VNSGKDDEEEEAGPMATPTRCTNCGTRSSCRVDVLRVIASLALVTAVVAPPLALCGCVAGYTVAGSGRMERWKWRFILIAVLAGTVLLLNIVAEQVPAGT
jgi:hypothetical protein